MAVFSRIKTWVSNEVLTASDLNGEINNLLNNTIPASIEDYSADVSTMQTTADPGGLGTESLATTLAGELTRLRFVIKRIVGGAQWYSTPDFDLTGTLSATNLASDSVTTAKILNANVTRAKLEAVGQQISSSCGSFSTASTSFVDVTNLSVSITTSGRPVVLMCQPDSASASPLWGNATSGASAYLVIDRSGTDIVQFRGYSAYPYLPAASIYYVDPVAAGTYTYKIQLRAAANTSSIQDMVLVAYEL